MTERPYSPRRQEERDRAILVGIERGSRNGWSTEESLEELARLADTAGLDVVATVTQRLDKPNPRTFIGAGKAEEIAELAERLKAKVVVFDDDLSPSQQYNLEGLIPEIKIDDRTALILEIFALHATSREGKLQVELAQLEYLLPRLRGMWGHLERERLGGGRGARFGAGESQLETDRRLARRRISELKRELRNVSESRKLQRKARARAGVYRVALVGYTNAGKSTLLNALTGAGALSADMLFATLDATTRKLELPEGREITITDTVGFINKLPHTLVEAFKSTLDEVREADLLLHVVDASAETAPEQMRAVREVLGELDSADKPQVVVYNKVDMLPEDERAVLERRSPGAEFVSAMTGEGIPGLLERIAAEATRGSRMLELLVPYDRGDVVQIAHERTSIVSESHLPDGTHLIVRAPVALLDRLQPFEVDGDRTGGR